MNSAGRPGPTARVVLGGKVDRSPVWSWVGLGREGLEGEVGSGRWEVSSLPNGDVTRQRYQCRRASR